jgi:UDP-glucuronate decarboxylase
MELTKGITVMVTGGAGFIGSHLCKLLIDGGIGVVCVDNLHTGRRENIKEFGEGFIFLEQDIKHPLQENFPPVDFIFNLACPASPINYQRNPVDTLLTNVVGVVNVLEYAKQKQIPVLQASTSEVYGDPQIHPQVEIYWGNVNPIGPRACYDEGKRCAETLFFDYHRQFGLEIKVARIFNTYGPNMDIGDGRVVSNFIVQALRGEDITVYGEGKQTRSFCYVDDLVRGLVRLAESESDFLGPVNLGNPGEFTVLELAEKVIRLTKSESKIIFNPLPVDDPTRRKPDISLAKSKLGWQPKIDLEEGLLYTINYFISEMNNPRN